MDMKTICQEGNLIYIKYLLKSTRQRKRYWNQDLKRV